MEYVFIAVFLFVAILFYFRVADKYNIIDKPNSRSSHTAITIRGGGIIFPLAMLLAYFMGYASLYFMLTVLLTGLVSFIDDIKPLHQLPRFSAHLIATALIVYDLGIIQLYPWLLPIIFIVMIAWINAFNFMDGINGITVLYAIVAVGSFGYIYFQKPEFDLLVVMAIACGVFGFFNVRKKARTFAGDVGSIAISVLLAGFMIRVIYNTEEFAYILLFSIYGVDSFITILYRLRNKENIFEAHRSHLYQYLANELKWSHLTVSFTYALLQLLINLIVFYLIANGLINWIGTLVALAVIGVVYVLIRERVKNKIGIN